MDDPISRLLSLRSGRTRRVRNDTPVPFSSARGSLFSNSDAGSMAIADQAYQAYGGVGTLFAIVSQIGNAVCRVPWHLYRKSSQPVRDKATRQEVTTHPFLSVWNKPNDFYTNRALKETVQQHLDLVGEGIIVLNGVGSIITEMWPVRPDRMQPIKHPTKFMTGWMYTGPDGEEVPLDLNQVIQIKYPNPADPYRGLGPVQTVLSQLDSARYSAEWNRNFFINGARPGGIIELDYRMGDDEFAQFVSRWRQQHQGVANAHRVAVLENAKWVDTKFSMADMQFTELAELSAEQVRIAFAYPKPMLGTVDDVNRANADAGKEVMAEMLTDPRLSRWKDVIDSKLLPLFLNGKSLEYDYEDPTPVNSEAEDRQRLSQTRGASLLTLAGYEPKGTLEAMGLPDIPWVGIPVGAGATSSSGGSGSGDNNNDSSTSGV